MQAAHSFGHLNSIKSADGAPHALEPPLAVRPAEQPVQAVAAVPENVSTGHMRHGVAELESSSYCPLAQSSQAVDSAPEKVPAGQSAQTWAPSVAEKLPRAHGMHGVCALSSLSNFPAEQSVHAVAPSTACDPAAHGEHDTALLVEENEPAAHGVHRPDSSNVPALHWLRQHDACGFVPAATLAAICVTNVLLVQTSELDHARQVDSQHAAWIAASVKPNIEVLALSDRATVPEAQVVPEPEPHFQSESSKTALTMSQPPQHNVDDLNVNVPPTETTCPS